MFSEREKWVPYPPLKTIPCLPLRTRHIWVNGYPCTRENRDNAAPNNVPGATIMCKVGARVRIERATVDRVGADRVSQVVDEKEKQHFESWGKKGPADATFYGIAQRNISILRVLRGRGQWVNLGPIGVITVRVEGMKQGSRVWAAPSPVK